MSNIQKKHRFNIIDVLIILVIVSVVAVMYYFTVARNNVVTNNEVTIEYTVELKTVRSDHTDNIKKGDKVVETVRDQQIGEVVAVDIVPSYNTVTNADTGEMFISQYPAINAQNTQEEQSSEDTIPQEELLYDYYNVRVTIRQNVKKSEVGYSINGFDVVVGELVHFRVPEYVNSGYCVSIREIAE